MDWWQTKLTDATYLSDYRLHVRYAHGLEADVDLQDLLDHPFYAPLRDKKLFAHVKVDEECRILIWPNDIDMAPEILYERAVKSCHPSIA